MGPFSGSIHFFHVTHSNGVVTNLRNKLVFESKDYPLDDDEGGVGGLNCTPHLVKPLVMVTIFPILGCCSPSMVNLKPSLGI
jgi:hypothetical protein